MDCLGDSISSVYIARENVEVVDRFTCLGSVIYNGISRVSEDLDALVQLCIHSSIKFGAPEYMSRRTTVTFFRSLFLTNLLYSCKLDTV